MANVINYSTENIEYYNTLMQNMHELAWLTDENDELISFSHAFQKFVDNVPENIYNKNLFLIYPFDNYKNELQEIPIDNTDSTLNKIKFAMQNKNDVYLEITKHKIFSSNKEPLGILWLATDTSSIVIAKEISKARSRLQHFASQHNLYELLIEIINEAKGLTNSKIGFCTFIENDQETISLQIWSTNISEDPILSDILIKCIKNKRALVYAKQLVVPVFRDNKLVAVLGIGNKPTFYTEQNIISISKLADLSFDIALQKKREEELNLLARYDSLTKLPNRIMLIDRLELTIEHNKRTGKMTAVCMLDLDGFKPINDTYGHKAGDIVLQEVAKRLMDSIRKNDTAARLGGDEFVVVIGDLRNANEAEDILDSLIKAIAKPIQ
ncbi:MAG: hypothetical protein RL154_1125, partial [Pseudomonadota bacterium]